MNVVKYQKRNLLPKDLKAEGLPVDFMQFSGSKIIISFSRDLTAEEEAKLDTLVSASTAKIVEKTSLTEKEMTKLIRRKTELQV